MKLFDCGSVRLWEKPRCAGINVETPRSTLFPYDREEDARKGGWEPLDCPNILDLNGQWRFSYHDRPEQVRREEVSEDCDDSGWDSIAVPGNWTMQGYDHPHYTNVQMPWPEQPPRVPEGNPTGVYRRTFVLDAGCAERRTVLHFGGVESCFFVFVNGREAGMAKDSRTDAEFEVTGLVHPGTNSLAVVVLRWSDGSFLEDQDHWWMAGIHRGVYLYQTRREHIRDVFVRSRLENGYRDGRLQIKVTAGFSDPVVPEGYAAVVRLYDGEGAPALPEPLELAIPARAGSAAAYGEIAVPAPRRWSAEEPNLYRLTVELLDPGRHPVEATGCRIGFRSVELKDGRLLVNGRPVRFFGVNRHDHDPRTGKAVSVESMRRDIVLMKRFNFNALRTCHYPNDPRLLALCDEYGIYVVDEANIECHAFYDHLTDDPAWLPAMLDRVSRMVLRDKNHPCVVEWSLGNESGCGANFGACAGWIRAADPGRLVHYEGALHRDPWNRRGEVWRDWVTTALHPEITDVVCPMYPTFAMIRAWLRHDDPRPMILCEYSHAMGNSNGALKHYFELFREEPRMQGGYIWDWVDQGLERTDAEGRTFYAYGGDFGDTPTDHDFCINGLMLPDRTPHPGIHEFKFLARPFAIRPEDLAEGRFRLRNHRCFLGLDDLEFTWRLEVDGIARDSGRIAMPAAVPQGEVEFQAGCGLPDLRRGEEARIVFTAALKEATAYAEAGFVVAEESVRLPARRFLAGSPALPKRPFHAEGRRFAAGDSEMAFGEDGLPLSWRFRGREILAAPPKENCMRGLTENDAIRALLDTGVAKAGYRWIRRYGLDKAQWRPAGPADFTVAPDGVRVVSEAVLRAANGAELRSVRDLRFQADGILAAELEFDVPGELDDLPRLGWTWTLPAGFENLRFLGNGPFENYPDRNAGSIVSLYRQTVSMQYFPYIVPQECGNHTEVRWVAVDDGETGLLAAAAGQPVNCSALHCEPADLNAAMHTNELRMRKETFLNLDAAQRGLGTASCGEDTLPQYRIHPGVHRLKIRLTPFPAKEDPAELYLRLIP